MLLLLLLFVFVVVSETLLLLLLLLFILIIVESATLAIFLYNMCVLVCVCTCVCTYCSAMFYSIFLFEQGQVKLGDWYRYFFDLFITVYIFISNRCGVFHIIYNCNF